MLMARVTKTIGGRQYYYDQHSVRTGKKVKTTSIYIGPVNPIRKKGILHQIFGGAASMAALAAVGKLGKAGGSGKKSGRPRAPDPRSMAHERERFVDTAHRDSKAALDEIMAKSRMAGLSTKSQPPVSEDMKAFIDRVAEVSKEQAERLAPASVDAPAAAEGTETPDAPTS